MSNPTVQERYDSCKSLIRKGRLEEALEGMERLVTELRNRGLEDSYSVLSARYHTFQREKTVLGQHNPEQENHLFFSAIQLLDDILEESAKASPVAASPPSKLDTENQALRAEIQALQDQMGQLLNHRLERMYIPPNYASDLSKEYQFAFCYPQEWSLDKNKEVTYCNLVDEASMERLGFARNLNIVINEIQNAGDLRQDAVLELTAAGVAEQLAVFHPEIAIIFEETILLQGLPAKRWRIDYTMSNGARLALYQVQMTDREVKKLLTISCTTTQEDFTESKVVFDNILATLVL